MGKDFVRGVDAKPALTRGVSEAGKINSRGEYDPMSEAITAHASVPLACVARNSPVEISRNAAPTVSPCAQVAARYTDSRGSSNCGSTGVPGVTMRTTSRRTNFFAFEGSSVCSQMATR